MDIVFLKLLPVLLVIIVLLIVLLIIRGITLWYLKINIIVDNLQAILAELKQMNKRT